MSRSRIPPYGFWATMANFKKFRGSFILMFDKLAQVQVANFKLAYHSMGVEILKIAIIFYLTLIWHCTSISI